MVLPWVSKITSIYSSTEQKAVDCANILAEHLSLPFVQIRELGENDRSSTGFLPPGEFELMANEFFANPKLSIRSWERAIDAQQRVVSAVKQLLENDHLPGLAAIVSHGAVGTLLYCALTGREIDRKWDQPPNGGGNYFGFSLDPRDVYSWWRPIDEEF
ncbi:MAG: histidine phosphatase family protein [Terrimicrobiaceae bacterium]